MGKMCLLCVPISFSNFSHKVRFVTFIYLISSNINIFKLLSFFIKLVMIMININIRFCGIMVKMFRIISHEEYYFISIFLMIKNLLILCHHHFPPVSRIYFLKNRYCLVYNNSSKNKPQYYCTYPTQSTLKLIFFAKMKS